MGSETLKKVEKSSISALVEENQYEIEATPEMVGGPGVREDVPMTRSGGRKRAVRKVSESSRQKMQDRAKPTHLDFQDEAAAVTKEEAKLGSSRGLVVNNKSNFGDETNTARGRKVKTGLKKMLGKVPRALGFGKSFGRVSVTFRKSLLAGSINEEHRQHLDQAGKRGGNLL